MSRPRVIIVGAGFGGLFAARTLANKPVQVLLIDRYNYHTFTPLLYQVATCALDPGGIAYPIRNIFSETENISCLLGDVLRIDEAQRTVTVQMAAQQRVEPYDYLILATGSIPAYFGNEAFREHAWELRTLPDAVALRNHILYVFEQAAWTDEEAARQAMTTIVVVGGGPTGLETAGAIYELYNHVLGREFRQRELRARVVLVEMQPYLLAPYPDSLRQAALAQLRSLGVEVILDTAVSAVAADHVTLSDGRILPTHTLVWSAGVQASPLPGSLDLELKRGARVVIEPTTAVQGRERIYAVGDLAYLEDPQGQPYPMLIPVAQQQGILAAKNILAHINGRAPQPFVYHDRGIMATIGRKRAVAWIYNKYPLTGFIAWLAWLGLHLVTLLGFRNRLVVMINWIWNYVTYDRTVRLILRVQSTEQSPASSRDT